MNHERHAQRRLRLQTALLFVVALLLPLAVQLPAQRVLAQQDLDEISAQIAANGSARVIVSFDVPREPEAQLTPAQQRSQRSRIAQAQDLVSRRVADTAAVELRRLVTVPVSAYSVDAAALARLQADPLVRAISIDGLRRPQMYNSNGVIGADDVWASGITGDGQTVAVLDTGVDKSHPFLSGKVVSEACYSTTEPSYGSISLCPGGVQSSTAAGSGVDCNVAYEGCGHGSHVAGTIAGNPLTVTDGTSNYDLSGVAPDAQIIAIQVFTWFPADTSPTIDDSPCGQDPCVLSFDSDQMSALERVLALTSTYDIASVNMSLGGGQYASACDSDLPAYTALIGDLKDAGVATVIASGNNGFNGYVSFPACISTAVTVASTASVADYSGAPALDSISYFSNVSDQVDLYAPGQRILSSTGGGYNWFQGTSMATPHVAGAFALLGELAPSSTVDQRLEALEATGKSIVGANTAGRSSVPTIPRIRVERAVAYMSPPTSLTSSVSSEGVVLNWTNQMPDGHSVIVQQLPVNATGYTSLVTLTNQLNGAATYTDTSAVPSCSYRIAAKSSANVQTSYVEVDNTDAEAGMISFSVGKMGSIFTIYACGLPADTSAEVSINGEAQTSSMTDARGRLRVNLATSSLAAFGRYDVTVTVGSAAPIEQSYDLVSTQALRSAGAQRFFSSADTISIPSTVAPIVFDTLIPSATR